MIFCEAATAVAKKIGFFGFFVRGLPHRAGMGEMCLISHNLYFKIRKASVGH